MNVECVKKSMKEIADGDAENFENPRNSSQFLLKMLLSNAKTKTVRFKELVVKQVDEFFIFCVFN